MRRLTIPLIAAGALTFASIKGEAKETKQPAASAQFCRELLEDERIPLQVTEKVRRKGILFQIIRENGMGIFDVGCTYNRNNLVERAHVKVDYSKDRTPIDPKKGARIIDENADGTADEASFNGEPLGPLAGRSDELERKTQGALRDIMGAALKRLRLGGFFPEGESKYYRKKAK